MVKKTNENKRIFTDPEKDNIADFIFDNIITTGSIFFDQDFKDLALDVFLEKHEIIFQSSVHQTILFIDTKNVIIFQAEDVI